MKRTVLIAAVLAAVTFAWPAEGATPLGQLKQRVRTLERQMRTTVLQGLRHDELQVMTARAPVAWTPDGGLGTATVYCPTGYKATGGGVEWSGTFGRDSAVYYSQPNDAYSWKVGLRAGAGTTAGAYAVAQCARLG